MEKLKSIWWTLASRFTDDQKIIVELWDDIQTQYSSENRYYHSLDHLEYMMETARSNKKAINDYDTILFSIFYHDIIYDINRQDNEYQSSIIAQKSLTKLGVPEPQIRNCMQQTLATMSHDQRDDADINLFIDIDLAVLGEEWEMYDEYRKKIRAEYGIYPDAIYNSGRIVILKYFLNMEKIFKTPVFYDNHETRARENLKKELELLLSEA